MVLQWAHRYKNILTRNHTQMESALTRMLDKMESVMTLSKFHLLWHKSNLRKLFIFFNRRIIFQLLV